MFSPDNFTLLTIFIYLMATICGIGGMLLRRSLWSNAGCWLSLAAFFCQTLALVLGFHKSTGFSLGACLQLLAWFFLLCGIAAWWRLRQDAIILFASPFGLILFLMSASSLHIGINVPRALSTPFYALHIGALFLSMGLLALAFIAGIIFVFLEKRIKSRKSMRGFWEDMPALSILDRINSVCVNLSFPLYTTGIIAGLFWAKPIYGAAFSGDPKEICSLVVWLTLAALFHNRLAKGWKGRKPALLAVVIFLLSIFSILAINFFMPTHHAFIRN